MKYLKIIFISLLFFACESKNEIAKEFFFLKNAQDACNVNINNIFEKSSSLKEEAEDKSEGPDFHKKIDKLYLTNQVILDSLAAIINSIENLKEKILLAEGVYFKKRDDIESFQIQTSERKHYWTNPKIDLDNNYVREIKSLETRIFKYRAWVIHHVCKYNTEACDNARKFYFIDPKIVKGSHFKSKKNELEKSFINVAPDDFEGLKLFYLTISDENIFIDQEVDFFMEKQSLIKSLTVLTITESKILNATHEAVCLLRYRFANCGGYAVDKIFVNVDGPEAVRQGDSVELRLFYSFYNSKQEPIINIKNLDSRRYKLKQKDGIAYLIFKADKEMDIKGLLTILNKSGVPKTNEWSKKISVLK
ncbi:MAG: hypothetical protein V4622_07050 [Bacteroidota bacterium]